MAKLSEAEKHFKRLNEEAARREREYKARLKREKKEEKERRDAEYEANLRSCGGYYYER